MGVLQNAAAALPIVIMDGVYIGAGSIVGSGVTIGAGAIVRAGSVVLGDVSLQRVV